MIPPEPFGAMMPHTRALEFDFKNWSCNMASTLGELKMALVHIKGKLFQHPVFTRRAGLPIDDSGRTRELEELDALNFQLSIVIRELRNKSNSLTGRQASLWGMRPEDRYRAAASIRGQQAEVQEVLRLAAEIQQMLEDLIRNSGLIPEGDVAEGLAKFIEQMYHQAHTHGEVHNVPDRLSYVPAPAHGEFGGSIEGVTILVFMALHAYTYALKHLKRPGQGSR
jgi:hypothetical protein